MFLCEAGNTSRVTRKEKLFSSLLHSAKISQAPWLLFPHLHFSHGFLCGRRHSAQNSLSNVPSSMWYCSGVGLAGVTPLFLTTNEVKNYLLLGSLRVEKYILELQQEAKHITMLHCNSFAFIFFNCCHNCSINVKKLFCVLVLKCLQTFIKKK